VIYYPNFDDWQRPRPRPFGFVPAASWADLLGAPGLALFKTWNMAFPNDSLSQVSNGRETWAPMIELTAELMANC
jgi:hypothetical protein